MKLDTDFLKKHRFWLLLVLSLPLSLVALILLWIVVPRSIAEKRKNVDSVLAALTNAKDVKSDKWVKVAQQKADQYKKQETVVWEQAWNGQQQHFSWPDELDRKFNYGKGLFVVSLKVEPKDAPLGEGVKEGIKQFTGIVADSVADYIEVEGLGTDKSRKRFMYAEAGTMVLGGADEKPMQLSFPRINAGDRVTVTYEQGKYFGDPVSDNEFFTYHRSYKSQIAPILKQVEPMQLTSEGVTGVVQLRAPRGSSLGGDVWFYKDGAPLPKDAGFFNAVANFVDDQVQPNKEATREAWTAQEDIWIQRELYRLIRQANDFVSKFKSHGAYDAKTRTAVFSNPYWQMKLHLTEGNQLAVELKNLLLRPQKLDQTFRFKLRKGEDQAPFTQKLEGERMNPGQVRSLTYPIPGGIIPEGLFGVEQVLTWETAAVRRIDYINIGGGSVAPVAQVSGGAGGRGAAAAPATAGVSFTLSHRNFVKPLLEFPFPGLKKDDKAMGMGMDMGMGIAKDVGKDDVKRNYTNYHRYLELAPQARRVPVAVVLIVDQDHVSRVQTSFADSRLRFLMTQVLLHRYPLSLRPPESTTGVPVRPTGVAAPPAGDSGDDRESNMEMVLYGIVSLYERFPPRAPLPAS